MPCSRISFFLWVLAGVFLILGPLSVFVCVFYVCLLVLY